MLEARQWKHAIAAAFAILVAVPATPQEPLRETSDPVGPAATRDSVDHDRFLDVLNSDDVPSLRRLASRGVTGLDDDVLVAILAAHRLYEITGDGRYHSQALERARAIDTPTAASEFVLGHVLLLGPDTGLKRAGWYPREPAFPGWRDGEAGREHLRSAMQLDGSLHLAALDLATWALATRDNDMLSEARDALGRAIELGPATAASRIAAAHVDLALGDADRAAARAREALRLGADSAAAWYVLAKAIWRQGRDDAEAADAYLAGASRLDSIAALQYFLDLLPILSDGEEQEWEGLSLAQRGEWLEEFWTEEAALNGRTVEDRLADHYGRLATAERLFRQTSDRGAPPEHLGELLAVSLVRDPRITFDDRGIIHVRHGPPTNVVRTLHPDLPENETWAYAVPGEERVAFTFMRFELYPDWHIVDRTPSCVQARAQSGPQQRFYEDRAHLHRRFGVMLAKCAAGDVTEFDRMDLEQQARAEAVAGLTSRSDPPRIQSELPVAYHLYSFKRGQATDARSTTLEAAFLVSAGALESRHVGDRYHYALSATVVAADTVNGWVERRDTLIRVASPDSLTDGHYIRFTLGLVAPPSDEAELRFVVLDALQPSTGMFAGGARSIPAYEELSVSDVVLSDEPPSQGSDSRPPLEAAHTFAADDNLHVYFEVYESRPGTRYRIELAIRPLGDDPSLLDRLRRAFGGQNGVEVRFEQIAPEGGRGGAWMQGRTIDTALPAGSYSLTVTVSDLETGISAESATIVQLR